MDFYIHIGQSKTISSRGLIGIFSREVIINNQENAGVFPEIFAEDEKDKYRDFRTIFLYHDGYLIFGKIKPGTIVKRRERLKRAMKLYQKFIDK